MQALVSPPTAALVLANKTQTPSVFWVLEENWPAVQLLQACGSQWRKSPTGKVDGLIYEAVDVVIRRGGFEPFSTDDWHRLQTLERVVVKELST